MSRLRNRFARDESKINNTVFFGRIVAINEEKEEEGGELKNVYITFDVETDSGALVRHVRMLVQPFFRGASVAMARDKEEYRRGGYQINDIVICCRRGGVKGPA